MSDVKVEKGTAEKLKELDVENWGQWSCDAKKFDWEYDMTETCYLYQGQVTVTSENGESVSFGAGDIVTFPKGLKCTWDVSVPVRKRFRFD
jgi:uncharacterized protein